LINCVFLAFLPTLSRTDHGEMMTLMILKRGLHLSQMLALVGRCLSIALIVMLLLALSMGDADAARKKRKATGPTGPNNKYAAIVIDFETGQVLLSDQPDKQLHPASLTKIMTLLLVFEALSERRLHLTDYVRLSSRAAAMPASKVGLDAGDSIRVNEAIKAVTVKSANDIAVALAEALGGSEAKFVAMMNDRAQQLGMKKTRFVNASGWHNARQVSTPRDMAILARYVIQNYPNYYKFYGLRSFYYGGRTTSSHNKLMNTYVGMDGMKTGYVDASGFNLVASAVRDDRRIIGVVFGGRTSRSRNDQMQKLLDRGFLTPVRSAKSKLNVAQLAPSVDEPVLPPVPAEIATLTPPSSALAPENMSALQNQKALSTNKFPPRKPISQPVQPMQRTIVGTPQPKGANAQSVVKTRGWTVQIGAYQDREASDKALYDAVKILPRELADHANPVVAPLKTLSDGWLFRSRLVNLTEMQAKRACSYFRGCLLIAPEPL
jgi:D-alanyl-D-alanine carboxypeptidase